MHTKTIWHKAFIGEKIYRHLPWQASGIEYLFSGIKERVIKEAYSVCEESFPFGNIFL